MKHPITLRRLALAVPAALLTVGGIATIPAMAAQASPAAVTMAAHAHLTDATSGTYGTVDVKDGPGVFIHATLYQDGTADVQQHAPGGATVDVPGTWSTALTKSPVGPINDLIVSYTDLGGIAAQVFAPDTAGSYSAASAGIHLPDSLVGATSIVVSLAPPATATA